MLLECTFSKELLCTRPCSEHFILNVYNKSAKQVTQVSSFSSWRKHGTMRLKAKLMSGGERKASFQPTQINLSYGIVNPIHYGQKGHTPEILYSRCKKIRPWSNYFPFSSLLTWYPVSPGVN